ncbi:hypothetical protein B9Z19DRAFT_1078137 [Tuber borchii]|uniref:Uncharacterized protein n=1 Tax=Tuber borchii TaxID=42251 RepID=A0A2T6ZZM3_TUBBO|nr:hypothetical protein B9Z19DRAFT_1078137 [Tuber borchii]
MQSPLSQQASHQSMRFIPPVSFLLPPTVIFPLPSFLLPYTPIFAHHAKEVCNLVLTKLGLKSQLLMPRVWFQRSCSICCREASRGCFPEISTNN